MSTEKRRPTFTLCVKDGNRWREIGAVWETDRGNWYCRFTEAPPLAPAGVMAFPYREKRESRYAVRTWKRTTGGASLPARTPDPPPRADSTEPDYMERRRQERTCIPPPSTATPSPPVTPPGMDPDPEAPEWL